MRLTARLILVVMLAVTMITTVYGVLTVQREDQRLKDLMRDEAQTLGRTLEEEVVIQWRRSGHAGVVEFARRTSVRYGGMGVRWVPSDALRGQVRDGGQVRDEVVSRVERDERGIARLHTIYPIRIDQQGSGYLEFSDSLEDVESYKRQTWHQLLALLGAFLACGGFVTLVGVRLIGRPLQQLIEKTERIGAGDFGEPLEMRGYSELSRLAESLNRMCEELEESQRKIRSETTARLDAVEQLRHADRLKTVGQLASGVAHELGTPLNVAAGRAELIASGQLSADEVTRSARTIKTEVDRMVAIIRDLLDFARRRRPQRSDCDLDAIARQSLDLLEPLAHRRQVELRIHGDQRPMITRIDPGQIQQVITNLVDNAIQAQPDGGTVDVSLEATRLAPPRTGEQGRIGERDYFALSVEDQGPGIDPANLERIFEPFFTTKDVGEGTGLGLSVSFGIVQDHGGWIDVTSQPGEGSRFTVYLPRET